MSAHNRHGRTLTLASLSVLALAGSTACNRSTNAMSHGQLAELATRYAAAWSGQNPEALASFYAGNGSLTVNAGKPSVGRAAIAATAKAMTAGES